jgi:uncharacterized membrane-anchored protein
MVLRRSTLLLVLGFLVGRGFAQVTEAAPSSDQLTGLYQQLQNASAFERSVRLGNAVLKRDRVTITFTNGTVYLPAPVAGKVRSAIYIGAGTIQASWLTLSIVTMAAPPAQNSFLPWPTITSRTRHSPKNTATRI